jgi:glycosyltransferase 2 family protein
MSWADFVRLSSMTSPTWAALSILIIMAQIPLVGLRWCHIVEALVQNEQRAPRAPLIAITAIGLFFGQIAPNVVGESMRVWLLTRLGSPWREGLLSVLIDRGVGVGVLLAMTFCILLFPSGLTALGGYRAPVLAVVGALFVAGVLTLLLAPLFAPVFARWRFTRWLGIVASSSSDVLLHRSSGTYIVAIGLAIHVMTVGAIWSLGRAQGFDLSVTDAAALFAVMAGVALIPITVGGWGLRELAITALLQPHGVPFDQALFFSVSIGLVALLGTSVGAVVWALYTPERIAPAP